MSFLRLAWLVLALCCAPCGAHEDRPLTLQPDGTLAGLPPAFGPGQLSLRFAQVDGEPRLTALALVLHGRRIELPGCVLGLVATRSRDEVAVTASWDHDESVLPYYLQLSLFDPDTEPRPWGRGGFTLLFNLRTAKLMQMDVNVARERSQVVQALPIDLGVGCGADEMRVFWQPAP